MVTVKLLSYSFEWLAEKLIPAAAMKRQHFDVSPTSSSGSLKPSFAGAGSGSSDGRIKPDAEELHMPYAPPDQSLYHMHGADASYAPQQQQQQRSDRGAYVPFSTSHPYQSYADYARPVGYSGQFHQMPRGGHHAVYDSQDRRECPQTLQQYPRKSHRPMSPQITPPRYATGPPQAQHGYYTSAGMQMRVPVLNPMPPVQFPYPRGWPQWGEYPLPHEEKDEHEEKVVTTGHWSRKEEAILLTLVQSMVNYELKVIAQAAWDCNIHRNSRAVDKKLKRLIHYQTWKDRSKDEVLKTIKKTLAESTYKLTETESSLVKDVIEKYTQK